MFTFEAAPVKFVGLLVVFAWCTAWCLYELTRPQDARQRTSNALHLVMALVMLLMVAPPTWKTLTAVVPVFALVGVFALAVVWFVGLSALAFRAADRRGGWHFAGHAAMFAAMVWHLSAMGVMEAGMSQGMGGMGHGGMGMGDWMTEQSAPGGVLWTFALVGIPLMAYLGAAGVVAVRAALLPRAAVASCSCGPDCTCGPECASCHGAHARQAEPELVAAGGVPATVAVLPVADAAMTCHEVRPVGSRPFRLAALSDAAMNLGMFWMSTGLLVPILPFFAMLSF